MARIPGHWLDAYAPEVYSPLSPYGEALDRRADLSLQIQAQHAARQQNAQQQQALAAELADREAERRVRLELQRREQAAAERMAIFSANRDLAFRDMDLATQYQLGMQRLWEDARQSNQQYLLNLARAYADWENTQADRQQRSDQFAAQQEQRRYEFEAARFDDRERFAAQQEQRSYEFEQTLADQQRAAQQRAAEFEAELARRRYEFDTQRQDRLREIEMARQPSERDRWMQQSQMQEMEARFRLQKEMMQTELSSREMARLQSLKNQKAAVMEQWQQGFLSGEQAQDLITQLETGINPLEHRLARQQMLQRREQMNMMAEERAFQAELASMDSAALAQRFGRQIVTLPHPLDPSRKLTGWIDRKGEFNQIENQKPQPGPQDMLADLEQRTFERNGARYYLSPTGEPKLWPTPKPAPIPAKAGGKPLSRNEWTQLWHKNARIVEDRMGLMEGDPRRLEPEQWTQAMHDLLEGQGLMRTYEEYIQRHNAWTKESGMAPEGQPSGPPAGGPQQTAPPSPAGPAPQAVKPAPAAADPELKTRFTRAAEQANQAGDTQAVVAIDGVYNVLERYPNFASMPPELRETFAVYLQMAAKYLPELAAVAGKAKRP